MREGRATRAETSEVEMRLLARLDALKQELRGRRRESERLAVLSGVLEAAAAPAFAIDLKRVVVHWGKAAQSLYGLGSEQTVGGSADALFAADSGPPLIDCLRQTAETGFWRGERVIRRSDGGDTQVETVITPVRASSGAAIGYAIVDRPTGLTSHAPCDVVDAIPFGLLVCRFSPPDELTLLGVNAAAERFTGLRAAECRGKRLTDAWPAVGSDSLRGAFVEVMCTGEWFEEQAFVCETGGDAALLRVVAFRMDHDRLGVALEDMGRLTRIEQALRDKHLELEQIFDAIPDALVHTDAHRRVAKVNPAFTELFGYAAEEIVGRSGRIVYADGRDFAEQGRLRYHPGASVQRAPYRVRYRKRNGDVFLSETISMPVLGAQGDIAGFVGVIRDITEREQAAAALRESEERYRTLVEASPTPIVVHDGGVLIYANAAAATLHGASSAEELLGKSILELTHPDCCEAMQRRMCDLRARPDFTAPLRLAIRRFDGERREVDITAIPIVFDGKPRRLALCEDITDRLRAERDYQTLFDCMIDSFAVHELVYDGDGKAVDYRFLKVNPAFERTTGLRAVDIIGRTMREVLPGTEQAWLDRYVRVAETGEPEQFEEYHSELGRSYEVSAFRTGERQFACVFIDVTERRKAEVERERLTEQLRHAQKLEAVGQLAGGVAHDFNNILTAILGNAELLRADLQGFVKPDDPLWEGLEQIVRGGQRAAGLTRQLLAFSRKQLVRPSVLEPRRLLCDMERMLRRLIREDIEMTIEFDADVANIRADEGQIEQVIVNLVVNARDAMPAGGALHIQARNVSAPEDEAAPTGRFAPYVEFSFADTGEGMDDETKERIFEPFFTTKHTGGGTGLGLATVHGVVTQSGGRVSVESSPNHGSTFRVLLPAVSEPADEATPHETTTAPRGDETVLVCEDDAAVRSLTSRTLRERGYDVLTAANADEALDVMRRAGDSIRLLVTDVIMPGMNGAELAREVTSAYPGVRVLFISGYTNDVIGERGAGERLDLLQKPYTSQAMLQRVRQLLDG